MKEKGEEGKERRKEEIEDKEKENRVKESEKIKEEKYESKGTEVKEQEKEKGDIKEGIEFQENIRDEEKSKEVKKDGEKGQEDIERSKKEHRKNEIKEFEANIKDEENDRERKKDEEKTQKDSGKDKKSIQDTDEIHQDEIDQRSLQEEVDLDEDSQLNKDDENLLVAKKSSRYTKVVEYEGMFDGEKIRRILESKFPIAPDGYIQNSVVRQKVRPPTPKVQSIAEWRLRPAPDGELPWQQPSEEDLVSGISSKSGTRMFYDSESGGSFKFSSFGSLSSFPDFSVGEKMDSVLSSPDLGLMGALDSPTQVISKVMFFQEVQEREELHHKEEGGLMRSDLLETGANLATGVPLRASQSDMLSSQPVMTRASPSNVEAMKRDNMKARLKEQRQIAIVRAAEQKTAIPKILKVSFLLLFFYSYVIRFLLT